MSRQWINTLRSKDSGPSQKTRRTGTGHRTALPSTSTRPSDAAQAQPTNSLNAAGPVDVQLVRDQRLARFQGDQVPNAAPGAPAHVAPGAAGDQVPNAAPGAATHAAPPPPPHAHAAPNSYAAPGLHSYTPAMGRLGGTGGAGGPGGSQGGNGGRGTGATFNMSEALAAQLLPHILGINRDMGGLGGVGGAGQTPGNGGEGTGAVFNAK